MGHRRRGAARNGGAPSVAGDAAIQRSMPLTSPLRSYDPQWPAHYHGAVALLRPIFGAALVAIHHVGSTAVPGLSAKAEIDILAIVDRDRLGEGWDHGFGALGYRRGGDLSAGHHFLKRDVAGVRTHKLHVCEQGHATAAAMLAFRDHLRAHADVRRAYEALKLRLEADNSRGIGEYLDGKAPFIRAVLADLTP